MQRVQIEVHSDFICPWCWIGHRNLAAALDTLDAGAQVDLRYRPFELNPSMPPEGMDRRVYRTQKFGSWARSQSMDAQVTAAGLTAGAQFDYSRVSRTPNTRLAHRLMTFAQTTHTPQQTAALYDALFAAYFAQGRDIGDLDTLIDVAMAQGFDGAAVRAYLSSTDGLPDIGFARGENVVRRAHVIQAVPSVVIDGSVVAGAQPVAVFVDALRAAVIGRAA